MTAFIFTDILMLSASFVLYLMVRALPRVNEEPPAKPGLLDRWAHSELPEKIDARLNGFLLKFLRKVKIVILKVDNTLSTHLQKIKSEEARKEAGIDFKDITGENKETESE